ncbi:MAG: YraN family protein [Flavobacteriaceae bacterium]|nr:YraN family protein [Flavobacteriaceae bacterium]MDZ4148262.1 YraN family protein [Flavobacteriaceae bacterium]
MASHNDLGKSGEQLAVDFLKNNGYKIIEQNYFFQKAEVDIIARKGNILAVVEVKSRTGTDFGDPETFVSKKKIQLLVKAIDHYVISKDLDVDVRFDIIAIVYSRSKPPLINHLEDAFYFMQ